MASKLCLEYTGVIEKQKNLRDEGGFPGDSPLDRTD